MFRDEVLVLTELGDATVRSPMGVFLVVERHVHVRVVLQFVELVRSAVCDEDEVDLVGINRSTGTLVSIPCSYSNRTYDQLGP